VPPLRVGQPGLGRGEPLPSESLNYRQPRVTSQLLCQKLRLIESTLPLLSPMERYRNNRIELPVLWQRAMQQLSQWTRERSDTAVFEQMNELRKRLIVRTKTIGALKSRGSGPAKGTTSVRPQWPVI